MFRQIDSKLLMLAQKVCDAFQRFTGLTKFTLQKWALVAFILIHLWHKILESLEVSPSPISVLITGVMVIATCGSIRITEIEEQEFLKDGSIRQPYFDDFRKRFPWVFANFYLTVHFFPGPESVECVLIAAWVYFMVCVPRPPSKSKMREGYEKVLWWLSDMLQPAPAPSQ